MSYFAFISSLLLRKLNKRRVFVQSFCVAVTVTSLFVLLVDPRQFSTDVPIPVSQTANQFEITNVLENTTVGIREGKGKPALSGYTGYTIQRLGLKPIPLVSPLESTIKEPVINDVLSFNYPIDISPLQKFKCPYWANQSLDDNTANKNQTLLIVVISAAAHSAKRNLIRNTWAGPNLLEVNWIQLIFLVGSTLDEDKVLKERLKNESIEHGDLVQVNIVDTYANLTRKSVALLHWAHGHCPSAKLVLKCDDDTYLNLNVLINLLGKEQFQHTNRLYGLGIVKDRPQRDPNNKYYISRSIWPWNMYPAFLSGGGYLMGRDTIQPLLSASQTTPFFPLEDVFLTGICARKARIMSVSSRRSESTSALFRKSWTPVSSIRQPCGKHSPRFNSSSRTISSRSFIDVTCPVDLPVNTLGFAS